MSDLISRSALLEVLKFNRVRHTDDNGKTRQLIAIDIDRLIEYVEKMPTAYDVGKVLEQIEDFYGEAEQFGVNGMLSDIVEVIKAGGKSEED